MSEPIKKPRKTPESFNPKKPEIANMMDALCSEKVIDTFVIEGVEFTIIEKGKTLYAGAYSVETDIAGLIASNNPAIFNGDWDIFQGSKGINGPAICALVQNVISPDYTIALNIDYMSNQNPPRKAFRKRNRKLGTTRRCPCHRNRTNFAYQGQVHTCGLGFNKKDTRTY